MARDALHVCVVEDEARLRELLVRETAAMGYHAAGFGSAEEAWPALGAGECHVAIIDLNLPGEHGMELIRRLRARRSDLAIVILTGFGTLDSAVLALRLGAVDYLTKPCSLGQIETVLARVDQARLRTPAPAGSRPAAAPGSAPLDRAPHAPTLEELEREHVLAAMHAHHGHKPAAARALGISLRTLYNKLSAYRSQGFIE